MATERWSRILTFDVGSSLHCREITQTLSPGHRIATAIGLKLAGGDNRSRVLAIRANIRALAGGPIVEDSGMLLLATFQSGKVDTIGKLRGLDGSVRMVPSRRSPTTLFAVKEPFATREQAVLFPDGWIAIARLSPYRIEWRDPDGRTIAVAAVGDQPMKVEEVHKQAMLSEHRRLGREHALRNSIRWPPNFPPFGPDALTPDPVGFLLVRRFQVDTSLGHRFDVFDRRGLRVRTYSLGPRERLVAIGREHAYIVRLDADGIETLHRVPKP